MDFAKDVLRDNQCSSLLYVRVEKRLTPTELANYRNHSILVAAADLRWRSSVLYSGKAWNLTSDEQR
jgi:hypothetical protein